MKHQHSPNRSRKSRNAHIAPKLEKKLSAYAAAAAAAGVGLMAAVPATEAEVVYTPKSVPLGHAGTGIPAYYYLDLNNDGITDIMLVSFLGATVEITARSLDVYPCYCKAPNAVVGTNRNRVALASALPEGVEVGPNQPFVENSVFQSMAAELIHKNRYSSQILSTTFQGQFANGGKGVHNRYLGFKFLINGEVHYGWARFTISLASFMTGYAYETVPNKPILTGIPRGEDVRVEQGTVRVETRPSASLGALARGAGALPVWRSEEPGK